MRKGLELLKMSEVVQREKKEINEQIIDLQ